MQRETQLLNTQVALYKSVENGSWYEIRCPNDNKLLATAGTHAICKGVETRCSRCGENISLEKITR